MMSADEWNEKYPSGTYVCVELDDGSSWFTLTRSEAWTLPSGHHVVLLQGRTGGFSLERVTAVDDMCSCLGKGKCEVCVRTTQATGTEGKK